MDFMTLPDIDCRGVFGDGTHESTSLCMDWLKQNRPENKSVIDYGSGSGILSLLSYYLGASEVQAVDEDPHARDATARNCPKAIITENPVPADIVIANVGTPDAQALAGTLRGLTKETLIIGGTMLGHVKALQNIYGVGEIRTRNEWAMLIYRFKG